MSSLPSASDYSATLLAHAEHYTSVVSRSGPRLHGSSTPDAGAAQLSALRLFSLELENSLAAFDFALGAGTVHLLEQLTAYLHRYAAIRGDIRSVAPQYARALKIAQDAGSELTPRLEFNACAGLCAVALRTADYVAAQTHAETLNRLAPELADPSGRALALRNTGLIADGRGQALVAREAQQQALDLSSTAGDSYGVSAALSNLALAAYGQGDMAAARDYNNDALTHWRASGDVFGESATLLNLGNVETIQGNLSVAIALYEQAFVLARILGNKTRELSASIAMGFVQRKAGEQELAASELHRSAALARELGDRPLEATALGNLAMVVLELQQLHEAAELFQQALQLTQGLGNAALQHYLCIPIANLLAQLGQSPTAEQILEAALEQLQLLDYTLDADDMRLVAQARSSIKDNWNVEATSSPDLRSPVRLDPVSQALGLLRTQLDQ